MLPERVPKVRKHPTIPIRAINDREAAFLRPPMGPQEGVRQLDRLAPQAGVPARVQTR